MALSGVPCVCCLLVPLRLSALVVQRGPADVWVCKSKRIIFLSHNMTDVTRAHVARLP